MSNYDKFAEKIKSDEFRSSMKKFIDENCERYFKKQRFLMNLQI